MTKMQLAFSIISLVSLLCGSYLLIEKEEPSFASNQVKNTEVYIHIFGAVKNPGVYMFSHSPRVMEVIERAGGYSENVDKDEVGYAINLALVMQDQQKIYIPKKSDKQNISINNDSKNTFYQTTSNETLISINNSSIQTLDSLPGIGEVTAKKIIANRPYLSLDELVYKKIVKNTVFQKIKNNITL